MSFEKIVLSLLKILEITKVTIFMNTKREKLIDDIIKNEDLLARIDKLTKRTKLVCIKKCCPLPPKTYDNFREFLQNRKKEEFFFEEGKVYEANTIQNDYIRIISESGARLSFELLDTQREPERYPYIFNHFMLESEWLALQRDKKIDDILNHNTNEG